jgi:cytidylate kinase
MTAANDTIIVTIDGPAASGKTSVSSELAKRLGWSWVSTGAFYRGLAYVALAKKLPLDQEKTVAVLCDLKDWQVKMTDDRTQVFYQNKEVTAEISKEEVGTAASQISHYPSIRKGLLEAQRNCAKGMKGLIAEGRDCGTVVFPQAQVKIYLTARSEDRAQRRATEHGKDVVETLKLQQKRDSQDSQRATAPLQIPENAEILDTSTLGFTEVVDRVEQIVRQKLKTLS